MLPFLLPPRLNGRAAEWLQRRRCGACTYAGAQAAASRGGCARRVGPAAPRSDHAPWPRGGVAPRRHAP
ncbi:hypothetical protein, partial [Paracraurococcus ruber]|uniref:hypothetical protein n=1 Tax=Paracraurococcus ruber TaxID=77675 RepID=UPI001960C7BB